MTDETGSEKKPTVERRGQVASERVRFDLGVHEKVIGDALGSPPPGYGLTFIRGFVRDPETVVAVWDVNDSKSLARAENDGWGGLVLRIRASGLGESVRVPVGSRSGVYHASLPWDGVDVTILLEFEGAEREPVTIARSAGMRVPVRSARREGRQAQRVRVARDLDLRDLVRGDAPPVSGHRFAGEEPGAAARLMQRLYAAESIQSHTPALGEAGVAGVSGNENDRSPPCSGVGAGRTASAIDAPPGGATGGRRAIRDEPFAPEHPATTGRVGQRSDAGAGARGVDAFGSEPPKPSNLGRQSPRDQNAEADEPPPTSPGAPYSTSPRRHAERGRPGRSGAGR